MLHSALCGFSVSNNGQIQLQYTPLNRATGSSWLIGSLGKRQNHINSVNLLRLIGPTPLFRLIGSKWLGPDVTLSRIYCISFPVLRSWHLSLASSNIHTNIIHVHTQLYHQAVISNIKMTCFNHKGEPGVSKKFYFPTDTKFQIKNLTNIIKMN